MKGINEYTAYFKNLATQHILINHQDVSGKRAFVRANIEELLTGFRTGLDTRGYVLRLISPQWKLDDNRSDNIKKVIEGSLIVTGHHDNDDFAKQQEVMDTAETIVEDIIKRMRADGKVEVLDETALFYQSLKTLENINVYPQENLDENHSGWMLTFNIEPFFNPCVDKNNWKDL